MLHIIHSETFSMQSDNLSNAICDPICPSHTFFSLQVEDSLICSCSERRKDMWDFSAFSHPFYVASIFEEPRGDAKKLLSCKDEDIEDIVQYSSVMFCESRLCDFMKNEWMTKLNICIKNDNPCPIKQTSRCLTLIESPVYYIIQFIWENSHPSLINLLEAYSAIPYSFNINQIYSTTESKIYSLESMILYGSGHYISIIKKQKMWFRVDDESILQIGKWKDIISYILKSRFYPVGLVYVVTREHESNDIGMEVWIEFEKNVLQISGIREIKSMPSGWSCQCGNFNSKNFDVCEMCHELKPGVSGWVCYFCTTLNNLESKSCDACGNFYSSPRNTPKTSSNFNTSLKSKFPLITSRNHGSAQNIYNQKKASPPVEQINYIQSKTNPTIPILNKNTSLNETKCKCCNRKILENEYICIKCYIKSNSEICQLCSNKAYKYCCETCIRLSNTCEECHRQYLIIDNKCSCKKIFTY